MCGILVIDVVIEFSVKRHCVWVPLQWLSAYINDCSSSSNKYILLQWYLFFTTLKFLEEHMEYKKKYDGGVGIF